MIKRAEILSASGLLHGVVLDLSATGTRIYLASPVPLPEAVVLRLSDGATYVARCRWQQDAEVGFEFAATVAA